MNTFCFKIVGNAAMISRVLGARLFLAILCISSAAVVFVAFSRNVSKIKGAKDYYLHNHKKEDIIKKRADEDMEQELIFIGGMPRSGTTLMRTMLESHEDIRCGPETHIIPNILSWQSGWTRHTSEMSKLVEAGVAPKPFERAMAKFILNIVVHHGPEAKYYCNKDPYALGSIKYLQKLFPNIKFILMLRDARAVAHSIVTRKVDIADYNISDYRDVLRKWNIDIKPMYDQCLAVGSDTCLKVHYEQLVLRPVENTKRIFKFLGIPWTSDVLHHERHINDTHLSKFEKSTDQVKRPLYLDALTQWCDDIPSNILREVPFLAPTLSLLGYDPWDSRPIYGEPDDFVLGKLKL